jgi:DNA-directed RNA polymerase subunit RPC12/RpoP
MRPIPTPFRSKNFDPVIYCSTCETSRVMVIDGIRPEEVRDVMANYKCWKCESISSRAQ